MITRINKLLKEHKLILNLKTHVRNITRDMGLRPISDELLSSYDSNMDIVGTTFIGERDTASYNVLPSVCQEGS